MKAHTPLLLAVALAASLPAAANPPAFVPLGINGPVADAATPAPNRPRVVPIAYASREPHHPYDAPFFFAPRDEKDEARFREALPGAYFNHWVYGNKVIARIPARVRHATVGEALAHWEQYRRFSREQVNERDRAELMQRDPAEVLPHVWVVTPPLPQRPDKERMDFFLPGLGAWSEERGACTDFLVYNFKLPKYHHWFEVRELARGRYRLTLHASQPMDAAALDAALASASFAIKLHPASFDSRGELTRQPDGSWAGETEAPDPNGFPRSVNASARVRFDREASEASLCEVPLEGGRMGRGYRSLVFEVEEERAQYALNLFCKLPIPSVYGADVEKSWVYKGFPDPDKNLLVAYMWDDTDTRRSGEEEEREAAAAAPASDLALIQLPGKHDFVGYAYRRSSSAPLEGARLELLDESGNTVLASYEVDNGLVQGDFPKAVQHLRLICGEECLEQQVSREGYESRPHPLAPDLDSQWKRGSCHEDRRAYRPGDTVRLLGFVREFRDKTLHFPQVRRAELRYDLPQADGKKLEQRLPIDIASDGSYTCTFRLPEDMHGAKYLNTHIWIPGSRHVSGGIIHVQDTPVLAQTMEGSICVRERELTSSICVRTMDGTPLAGRALRWELLIKPVNPSPRGGEGYCFGDWRPDAPLPPAFKQRRDDSIWLKSRGSLDEQGRSEATFALPDMPFPRRLALELVADSGYMSQDNGTRHTERLQLDPATLAVGLRCPGMVSPVGSSLPLELLLVEARGGRYKGEPVEVEVTAELRRLEPGRYGTGLRPAPVGEEVLRQKLALPAGGTTLRLPLAEAGCYDIVVRGRDACGNEFASAIRQVAWNGGPAAPWIRGYAKTISPQPDKKHYRVGDTARLAFDCAFDGTALVMVQGPDSRRFLRFPVRAGACLLDIPLLHEDGPGPKVHIALVQGTQLRAHDGQPAVQRGECSLSVEVDASRYLDVQLDELPERMQAGESCDISGCVRDAEGKPVAHSSVLIFSYDVGVTNPFTGPTNAPFVVQEQGSGDFSRVYIGAQDIPRLRGVHHSFTSRWHISPGAALPPLHEQDAPAHPLASDPTAPRSSFFRRVRTDEQGRFSTHFTAPAGLADYQIIALASGQLPTQFGSAGELLHVEHPLSLRIEPADYAHVGDLIELPLHLRLSALPPGAPQRSRWRLRATGSNGAECPQAEQELELAPGELLSLSLPLRFTQAGRARLHLQLEALPGQNIPADATARVTATIPVVALPEAEAAPRLSRSYERRYEDGSWQPATHFQVGDIVRIRIALDGHSLQSADTCLYDYLPSGWQPILNEFNEGCAAAWVPGAIMECRHQSGWSVDFMSGVEGSGESGLCWTRPRLHQPLCLYYLARVTRCGELNAPPARVEGEVQAGSAPSRVQVRGKR